MANWLDVFTILPFQQGAEGSYQFDLRGFPEFADKTILGWRITCTNGSYDNAFNISSPDPSFYEAMLSHDGLGTGYAQIPIKEEMFSSPLVVANHAEIIIAYSYGWYGAETFVSIEFFIEGGGSGPSCFWTKLKGTAELGC